MGKALEDYKERVLAVAREVQETEGWCEEGLREALAKLDIEVEDPQDELEFDLVLKFKVRGRTSDVDAATTNEHWNSSSIKASTLPDGWALARQIQLDSDWSDWTVDYAGVSATEARPVED